MRQIYRPLEQLALLAIWHLRHLLASRLLRELSIQPQLEVFAQPFSIFSPLVFYLFQLFDLVRPFSILPSIEPSRPLQL